MLDKATGPLEGGFKTGAIVFRISFGKIKVGDFNQVAGQAGAPPHEFEDLSVIELLMMMGAICCEHLKASCKISFGTFWL